MNRMERKLAELQGRNQRAFAAGGHTSWMYRHFKFWRRLTNWATDYR